LHELTGPQAWLFLSDSRSHVQVASTFGWTADYPSAANFYFSLFSCASFVPNNGYANSNISEYCNRNLERSASKALADERTDPVQARREWVTLDHSLTREAPFVAIVNERRATFVSAQVGNYQSNWFSPVWDEMWVR
jgi:peptide/nickel transport system substrate-binding protein